MARIEPAMTALVVRKEYRSTHDPVYHDELCPMPQHYPKGYEQTTESARSLERKGVRACTRSGPCRARFGA
jgi:hypothetical protein